MAEHEVKMPRFSYSMADFQTMFKNAKGLSEEDKQTIISVFNECDKYKVDEKGNRVKGQDQKLDAKEAENFMDKLRKHEPLCIIVEFLIEQFNKKEEQKEGPVDKNNELK